LEEHGAKTKSAYEARINELEQRVTELIASNSLHDGKIAKLTEDNEKLSIENAEYRNKQRTAPGRGEAANNREIRRIPFWRVVGQCSTDD
jgi:regulator of replication initiation timing